MRPDFWTTNRRVCGDYIWHLSVIICLGKRYISAPLSVSQPVHTAQQRHDYCDAFHWLNIAAHADSQLTATWVLISGTEHWRPDKGLLTILWESPELQPLSRSSKTKLQKEWRPKLLPHPLPFPVLHTQHHMAITYMRRPVLWQKPERRPRFPQIHWDICSFQTYQRGRTTSVHSGSTSRLCQWFFWLIRRCYPWIMGTHSRHHFTKLRTIWSGAMAWCRRDLVCAAAARRNVIRLLCVLKNVTLFTFAITSPDVGRSADFGHDYRLSLIHISEPTRPY